MQRTRWTDRERVEGGREGDERGGGKGRPGFLPVVQMAVFSQPHFDTGMEDNEAVIKVNAVSP